MQLPTFEYIAGADLEDLGLFVRANGTLIDLSSGHTFSLKVVTAPAATAEFTKSSGFTGAAGSGVPPTGTPNLVVQWATSGELNSLTGNVTYLAQLTITRSSDGRMRLRQFYLRMILAA